MAKVKAVVKPVRAPGSTSTGKAKAPAGVKKAPGAKAAKPKSIVKPAQKTASIAKVGVKTSKVRQAQHAERVSRYKKEHGKTHKAGTMVEGKKVGGKKKGYRHPEHIKTQIGKGMKAYWKSPEGMKRRKMTAAQKSRSTITGKEVKKPVRKTTAKVEPKKVVKKTTAKIGVKKVTTKPAVKKTVTKKTVTKKPAPKATVKKTPAKTTAKVGVRKRA